MSTVWPVLDPRTALFLDFDGTLADLAPRPEAVCVAPGLPDTLQRLHDRLEGALAIVSGRPIEQIDAFLSPLQLAAAGVHGAQRRNATGADVLLSTPASGSLPRMVGMMEELAAQHAGLLVEHKPSAVALHYRLAPDCEAHCLQVLTESLRDCTDLTLLRGKMVLEVKPARTSKGQAIRQFLETAPFAGRAPVFVGDDVTDEAGFEAVQELGGVGIKVGDGPTLARYRIDSPAALRAWLESSLDALAAAVPPSPQETV